MKSTIALNIQEPPPPSPANFLPKRELEQISCGLLHDLINPITGLTLYLETLDPGQFRDIITPITTTSKTIRDYINILRDAMFRRPKKERVPIDGVAKHVVQILAHKALRNNVAMTIAQNTCNLSVHTEKIKIYQIILNLVSNAIDSFENVTCEKNKMITISISKKKMCLSLVIADNGCGMSPQALRRIFKESYTSKKNGSGFGLLHVQAIILELGGHIHVETKIGVGTKFYITLPQRN